MGKNGAALRVPQTVADAIVASAREHGVHSGQLIDTFGGTDRMCLFGHAVAVQHPDGKDVLRSGERWLTVDAGVFLAQRGQYDRLSLGTRPYFVSDTYADLPVDDWWSALLARGAVEIVEEG